MPELRQFNFKMPQNLYDKLNATAKAKDVRMTDLVIQGIQQVLGVAVTTSNFGVDLDIYQLIDKISERLEALEKDHVDTATKVHQLVPRLENRLEVLSSSNIANSIAEDIYNRVLEKIQEESRQTFQAKVQAAESMPNTDRQKNKTPEPETPNSVEQSISGSSAQLVIDLGDSEECFLIEANAKKVDSSEMLKTLQAEEPSRNWNTNLLVSYRSLKKHQNKWHQAGNCYFKYGGQQREKRSRVNKHFWLVSHLNQLENSSKNEPIIQDVYTSDIYPESMYLGDRL